MIVLAAEQRPDGVEQIGDADEVERVADGAEHGTRNGADHVSQPPMILPSVPQIASLTAPAGISEQGISTYEVGSAQPRCGRSRPCRPPAMPSSDQGDEIDPIVDQRVDDRARKVVVGSQGR